MLACDETITLVKYDGERYTPYVISGVSWFDKTQVKLEDRGLVFANAVKVRIPEESLGDVLPEVGDHIFRGVLSDDEVLQKPADLARHHARKVMAVGDNRRGRLAHLAVIGQ